MKNRNLFSSFHLLIQLLAALLVVVSAYAVLGQYHRRMDTSKEKAYSLSPQSVRILQTLRDQPIRIKAFYQDGQSSKSQAQNLFREFSYHHPSFRYEFYDPDRSPMKAKQYSVDSYETTVVEMNGKRERIKQVTEESLTNALVKLFFRNMQTVVFAVGYGGPSIGDEKEKTGYGTFQQALEDSNYAVKETFLPREGVGTGTNLLVVAGPHIDLLPEELDAIRKYFDSGGSVLFLVDPVDPGEGKNLAAFLAKFGVQLGDDVVVDKASKSLGGDFLVPFVTEYKSHAITQGFRLPSFFPIARTVRKANQAPDYLDVSELAWTGQGSWSEKDLKRLEDGTAEFEEKTDQKGPLPVAVVISQKKGKGRMVVFGDSDFVNNANFGLGGNKDFSLNVVAWLTGNDILITIRPRARQMTPLYLKETDQVFLFYGAVVVPSLLVLAIGFATFLMRRKFR